MEASKVWEDRGKQRIRSTVARWVQAASFEYANTVAAVSSRNVDGRSNKILISFLCRGNESNSARARESKRACGTGAQRSVSAR